VGRNVLSRTSGSGGPHSDQGHGEEEAAAQDSHGCLRAPVSVWVCV